MCPPMWEHWRHLANTIKLALPSAHPSYFLHYSFLFDSAWQIELAVRQLLGARIVYRIVSYRVHNSNGKSIGSAAPPQPTAEGPRATLSHNIAPSQGGYGPLSNS